MMPCFRPLALLAALLPAVAVAQTIPPVGTDATLDVGTWNIEHFGNTEELPSNEALQFKNVLAVLRQAEVDVWGLQELDDEDTFHRLLDSLGTGFGGFWQEDDTSFDIGYGFVYRTDVVTVLGTPSPILTGSSYEFGSRPPLQVRARVALPDTTVEVRFINVHMKAGGSTSDYDRRLAASGLLKNYVDNLQAVGAHVVVAGDLNDELITSIAGGRTSPYQNFLDDASYLFATREFDQPGSGNDANTYCGNSSTCSSGSVFDHVIATANLIDDYEEDSAARLTAVLSAIPVYTSSTSDHLPVFARFDFASTGTPNEPEAPGRAFALQAPFPNPFTDEATFTYTLDRSGPVRLELFDALGRRVALVVDAYRAAGSYRVRVNGSAFAPGLYVVRLTADGRTATRRLVRSR